MYYLVGRDTIYSSVACKPIDTFHQSIKRPVSNKARHSLARGEARKLRPTTETVKINLRPASRNQSDVDTYSEFHNPCIPVFTYLCTSLKARGHCKNGFPLFFILTINYRKHGMADMAFQESTGYTI